MRVERHWQGAGGVRGEGVERLFARRVLQRRYDDELERLDRNARTAPPGTAERSSGRGLLHCPRDAALGC
jgi:hypothetical protein